MNLLKDTEKLLSETALPYKEIAKNSKVGYRWLMLLIKGKYKDPGINKVQRVYDALSKEHRNALSKTKIEVTDNKGISIN